MKRQPVRNKHYRSIDTDYSGICPRFSQRATIYIHLGGKQESKYDLQPTLTPHIKECNLLKERNDKNTVCMLSCPVFEAYKNSHSY
jgi:hypothetical protein